MPVHDCIESHITGPGVVNRDSTPVLDQMLDIFRVVNLARPRRVNSRRRTLYLNATGTSRSAPGTPAHLHVRRESVYET